jgi:multiple sugar transport system substrate-binding protein
MERALWTLTMTVLFLAGCTSDGDAVRVQVSGEPEETAVYEAVARAFEEDHPDVDIELVQVADKDDHLARLTTSFAAGDPPDIFLINYREYSQFVARDALQPVESFLEEAEISLGDYYPHPIEAFTYDGVLQCMPQNISSLVVYYNRTLFSEAGLERPRAGWTWEDFRSTALALTEGDVRGLGIEPNIIRIAPFVWSNGGEIVDDPEAPTRFVLDTPEAREAIEFIVSLVRDDRVVPTETEIAAQDLETRFVNGKLGMTLSSRRDTPVFREVLGLDWDVAPLPIADQPAGILHSDAYCMARDSDRHAEAFEFVAFATGNTGETITALGGRTVPSLEAVASSGAFLDPSQPPVHSKVFLDGIPHIRRTPVISTWPEIEDVSEEIFTRLFYEDGYTLDDALADLDEQTTRLFEEGTAP